MGNVKKWQWIVLSVLTVVVLTLATSVAIQSLQRHDASQQARLNYEMKRGYEQTEVQAEEEAAAQLVSDADSLNISVLGDSTGNDSNEWVQLWAKRLAGDNAKVMLYRWDTADRMWSKSPAIFGDGDREVTIWNAASAGATPKYALDNTDVFPDEADLLITNYGHNGTASGVRSYLSQILDEADDRWDDPSKVVTVQNPGGGAAEEKSATNHVVVRDVAKSHGLPVIDVNNAFVESDKELETLLIDDVHPNSDGSALWVETVTEFFGAS